MKVMSPMSQVLVFLVSSAHRNCQLFFLVSYLPIPRKSVVRIGASSTRRHNRERTVALASPSYPCRHGGQRSSIPDISPQVSGSISVHHPQDVTTTNEPLLWLFSPILVGTAANDHLFRIYHTLENDSRPLCQESTGYIDNVGSCYGPSMLYCAQYNIDNVIVCLGYEITSTAQCPASPRTRACIQNHTGRDSANRRW